MSPDFTGTIEQQVEQLKFFATRHSMAVSQAISDTIDVRSRVQALEEDRNRRDVADARAEEQMKAMLAEMSYVKETLRGIRGIMSKTLWIIAGAVILAAVNWALSGGPLKL